MNSLGLQNGLRINMRLDFPQYKPYDAREYYIAKLSTATVSALSMSALSKPWGLARCEICHGFGVGIGLTGCADRSFV